MSVLPALLILLGICLALPTVAAMAQAAMPFVAAALLAAATWRVAFPPKARRR